MLLNEKCPIWGTPAKIIETDYGEHKKVFSPRAGGHYEIKESEENEVAELDTTTKIKLTNWVVEQNRFGSVPFLSSNHIKNALSRPAFSVFERADYLLKYVDSKISSLSGVITFSYPTSLDEEEYEVLSWTGSTNFLEVEYLIKLCCKQAWLEDTKTSDRKEYFDRYHKPIVRYIKRHISLQPKGHARLAALNGANPEAAQAFVAMWFDPSMKEPYDKGLQLAILDSGYVPMRIDQKQHIGKIDDHIIAEIRRSRFIIADFTSGELEQENDEIVHVPRGGVYYEAGFAQGLNIPVIWTCREDQIGRIHFDTRQYNHITWKDPADLYKQLKNRIGAVIGDGPNKKNGAQ